MGILKSELEKAIAYAGNAAVRDAERAAGFPLDSRTKGHIRKSAETMAQASDPATIIAAYQNRPKVMGF